MSKAGKGDGVDAGVGSEHPVPENIPHLSSPVTGSPGSQSSVSSIGTGSGPGAIPKHPHHLAGSIPGLSHQSVSSPAKEGSFLKSETSVNDDEEADAQNANKDDKEKNTPGAAANVASEAISTRG